MTVEGLVSTSEHFDDALLMTHANFHVIYGIMHYLFVLNISSQINLYKGV